MTTLRQLDANGKAGLWWAEYKPEHKNVFWKCDCGELMSRWIFGPGQTPSADPKPASGCVVPCLHCQRLYGVEDSTATRELTPAESLDADLYLAGLIREWRDDREIDAILEQDRRLEEMCADLPPMPEGWMPPAPTGEQEEVEAPF